MTLERGTLLHKRYRIVEILGQGGMGSVYRAVDENLGVDVAVKENLFTTDEYARQFRLEAVILANLRHPNLPRVSDHFVVGEQGQYLVMDFIEGEDLRQRMERLGMISEDDAVQIGAAICDALTYLHTRKPPILHRDIKPGNVKITSDGHIYLVDFGLAKVVQGSQVTTTGARAMTPGYSPPEQYGTARTDPRTDIYSLGATLYAALSGIIPEDGLARAMDNAQLTPLRKRNTKVSRRLSTAIEKAMAVEPDDRFQSAEEFKKALLGSKSRTEQLNGNYTVSPPPLDSHALHNDLGEASTSMDPRKPAVSSGASDVQEEKPFISPGKRKREERKRRQRVLIVVLLLLLAVLGGVAYVNPSLLSTDFHNAFLFFRSPTRPTATSTLTSTATFTPLPTRTLEDTATFTATSIPPTATFTPTKIPLPVVTETLIPSATQPPTLTMTPSPTPRGGGYGQIAFASTHTGVSQIYLSDLTGKNIVPITNMTGGACQPSWSPDGTRLVFVSPCSGPYIVGQDPPKNTSLYIVNADGTNLDPLPTVPGGDFEPAWSPDGTRIAFTSLRDGNMQVYIMKLSDQSVTRLTNSSLFGSDATAEARQATWSPFSNQIALAVRRLSAYQIWTMTDTGQNPQQLVRSGQDLWDYYPIWTKDGKAIIFSERRTGAIALPWQMKASYNENGPSSAVRLNLGLGQSPIEHAALSSDGLWLAVQSRDTTGNTDIYYMMVAGSESTRLTSDKSQDFDPTWRPINSTP
ncbi:MAG TPA: protein kinase [Anaerolineales bacterium]|nr:protein kinase [Anaerolineales bacterium]